MLARVFKTADELGLQDHEHQALITVLYMAEDGLIAPDTLDMNKFHCGTKHCLAGWANTVNSEAFPELNHACDGGSVPLALFALLDARIPKPLHKLFGLGDSNYRYFGFNKAFAGLRSYLETGVVP